MFLLLLAILYIWSKLFAFLRHFFSFLKKNIGDSMSPLQILKKKVFQISAQF